MKAVIILILLGQCAGMLPNMSPFFFLCNYHGNTEQQDLNTGEVRISVSIKGNPRFYIPGQYYEVQISSDSNFDGFLLTGLYTTASPSQMGHSPLMMTSFGHQPVGQNFMCSLVHSHISRQPKHSLKFVWIAPPKGTGCMNFLATATLGQQVLFKDITVLQLCEKGDAISSTVRPPLATIHSDGVVFREDFENRDGFDSNLWSASSGAVINDQCGSVMHGTAAVFCEESGTRGMSTTPLNTTTASGLQFSIAAGSCRPSVDDENIVIAWSPSENNNCSQWYDIDEIGAPDTPATVIYMLNLPKDARGSEVCLRWQQIKRNISDTFSGCWALDNILVTNAAHAPVDLTENFDPVDPGNWLFFPGAEVKHKCQSDGTALVFGKKKKSGPKFATTRDIDLHLGDDILEENLLYEDFDWQSGLNHWQVEGADQGTGCGVVHRNQSLVFNGNGTRKMCTPLMDLTQAASVRFYFGFGQGPCKKGSFSDASSVMVFAENHYGHSAILKILSYKYHETSKLLSIPVPHPAQLHNSRLCWIQKHHGGRGLDVWAIDTVQILPRVPHNMNHFIQFSLNMNCGLKSRGSVKLEYSTNHGLSWTSLYQRCLTGHRCGPPSSLSSLFKPLDIEDWSRISLPLPYDALMPHVRFRWSHERGTGSVAWALDNVFIGYCPGGCNGHGTCHSSGCSCDFGFSGLSCNTTVQPNPTYLIEMLNTSPKEGNSPEFTNIKGASLSFQCGVVGSGKAMVFHGDRMRKLETVDLNTTNSRYLQFSIRVGSESMVGKCPPPDREEEAILLHYSCSGGIMWGMMKMMGYSDYVQPRVESLHLPESAKGGSCRFRWWQPVHSGLNLDVWAVDDITLTNKLYNTISVDFSEKQAVQQTMDVYLGQLGRFCGRSYTAWFMGEYEKSQSRILITDSMHIGPSYMIQFELVIGCGKQTTPRNNDTKVYLEYSVDHGMSWQKVVDTCSPPDTCSEYQSESSYGGPKYESWQLVTLPLPSDTWSEATRLRLRQSAWGPADSWAVSHLYIGQQCPKMCSGHGKCYEGVCRCNSGYYGDTCRPIHSLRTNFHEDFSMMSRIPDTWLSIFGGEVVGIKHGCGTIMSGESLYFSKNGTRHLISHDFNTDSVDNLHFYLRIGGSNRIKCQGSNKRQNNVLLQFSTDGGITWKLLKELFHEDFREPRYVDLQLPAEARSPQTRFQWWQPVHRGEAIDQWALDEIHLGSSQPIQELQDSFERFHVYDVNHWMTVTEGMLGRYCQSSSSTLVMNNQDNAKFALTKKMRLIKGDVVQFKINVGCSKSFSFAFPVLFQYSHDSGNTWHLVKQTCYLDSGCDNQYHEGSIYYSGPYGEWSLVVIELDKDIVKNTVHFRWWQAGGFSAGFALDDVYIGRPCQDHCHGRGRCHSGKCICDRGYTGSTCTKPSKGSRGRFDRFDNMNKPSDLWSRIQGGHLGVGCGVIDIANTLYFSGEGTREARTVGIDVTNIKMLQFVIRIGSHDMDLSCRAPQLRNEGVIVDFSTDNGATWQLLRVLDPFSCCNGSQLISTEIPSRAKTTETVFRWWQPVGEEGVMRAQWAIDSVVIGINETTLSGFQDDFAPMDDNVWFMAQNGVPRITCNSVDMALEFSKTDAVQRYAETWDFHVMPSTFLQFDIAMGCGGAYSTIYSVMLQYSVDMGRTWHPVTEECLPPNKHCVGYHLTSDFSSVAHSNWTRVTVYLPPGAVSPATRFRWLQQSITSRGNIWALDNVYLGDGCEWMCSGHGYCKKGKCLCDSGYTGAFCVPAVPLPTYFRDDFDQTLQHSSWPEVYGGEYTNVCGELVAGKAFTFYKDGLRLASTRDLDVVKALWVQFTFQYGCHVDMSRWSPEHSVILQYSNNGGISWYLMEEIHSTARGVWKKFYSVDIPRQAMTNSTRFRFWQPKYGGHMKSVWSIDNLNIGGQAMNPALLYETFDSAPNPIHWLFWPGGRIHEYCTQYTSSSTELSGIKSIVFKRGTGEKSLITTELDVGEQTVIQFDINVGCSSQAAKENPVFLEYSKDQGKTWQLVVPPCIKGTNNSCRANHVDNTVYYQGESRTWRRVVVPLLGLKICGVVRFRWYQGHFSEDDFAPEWAVDNVYIGPGCSGHCGGHGACMNGILCQCDTAYESESCLPVKPNPEYLKESFNGDSLSSGKWSFVSGGALTLKCGELFTGTSIHFTDRGARYIVTRDLDLSTASVIQFYIRRGCRQQPPDIYSQPVKLQFSNNGGITWRTIEEFEFTHTSNKLEYIALHMPEQAQLPNARLRWWQPSLDGTFREEWAIDQVFIGGDTKGVNALQDDFGVTMDTLWFAYPGGKLENAVCDQAKNALFFKGPSRYRYALSTDVVVTKYTFIQFELAMGCGVEDNLCYGILLQFSLDMGKTWQYVIQECLPAQVECTRHYDNSIFTSDVHGNWTRIILPLPYYTRSKSTRFRWFQPYGFYDDQSWALAHVYIGDECPQMCNGRGRCSRGQCSCNPGWRGQHCETLTNPLSNWLTEDFSEVPVPRSELTIIGGQVSKACGIVGAGTALHFTGACRRQLVTTYLDLSDAVYVQFYFVFGCISRPTHRNQGVLVEYSVNGGIQWTPLKELFYDRYVKPSFVSIMLPSATQAEGVQIRWWQPRHGEEGDSDWAIDNIIIGGSRSNPISLKTTFDTPDQERLWLTQDNADVKSFCGSEYSLATSVSKETVTMTTVDLDLQDNFILQFSISVGCNASWSYDIPPVKLQYSIDYGKSWTYLIPACPPGSPECSGRETLSSTYYNNHGWRNFTVILSGKVVSKSTRFRWQQEISVEDQDSSSQWAIDNVYIGQSCPGQCNGHGWCDYPHCRCEHGYGGRDCQPVIKGLTNLRDSFNNNPLDDHLWPILLGGSVGRGCGRLVDGTALWFTGNGQRLVQTIDLDLRNARFVQYIAMLGGDLRSPGCSVPQTRNDSVVMQYSTDGGISWVTLHVLDHLSFTRPHRIYIPLPLAARSIRTQIRWWQYGVTTQRPFWALDNVLIGGLEINPAQMQEMLNNNDFDIDNWEFHPNGEVVNEFCDRKGRALAWQKGSDVRHATTRQLIMQKNYMIHFKIVVGCDLGSSTCNTYQSIHLEYNTNPSKDQWELVQPDCQNSRSSQCKPYTYIPSSIYTANVYNSWKRVVMRLPEKTFSSQTRFRWVQKNTNTSAPSWGVSEVYIGETCPKMCSGRGYCLNWKCVCDQGYFGSNCQPVSSRLLSQMMDDFDTSINPRHWAIIHGGGIGYGCGALRPHAHGNTLFFSGCGQREAVTMEMDTSKASKIMFVLQIGSNQQSSTCNIDLESNQENRGVLLQYTTNKGIEWHHIAFHKPSDYLSPQRLSYDIPKAAQAAGVQFRWWQPGHAGKDRDQWAIDHLEIVMTRQDEMLRDAAWMYWNRYRVKRYRRKSGLL